MFTQLAGIDDAPQQIFCANNRGTLVPCWRTNTVKRTVLDVTTCFVMTIKYAYMPDGEN